MKAEELLQKLLEIDAPWQIARIRDDLGKKQLDVWLTRPAAKSSWLFGARTASVPADREHVWRHINLGDTRCLIHAEASAETSGVPWGGDAGHPFTNAMSRLVVGMMRDGIKLQSICAILDIGVGDLWKFKHGLDSGKTGLAAASGPGSEPKFGASPDATSRVPDADSPIWAGLLDSSVSLDIRLLSLRLLLTKMREQMRMITDPEVRLLKCYELQRFFVRYEKTLGYELSQIETLA